MEKSIISSRVQIQARWLVLIMMGGVIILMSYFVNSISPLKEELNEYLMANSYDFSFIVASYSLPSLVFLMGFFGGMFLDRFDLKITIILFGSIMLIGAFVAAYALTEHFNDGGVVYNFFNSFWSSCGPAVKLMALGFFIFGIGTQAIRVSVTKIISFWFDKHEISTALALRSIFTKVGIAIALIISPIVFDIAEWQLPLWFGFGVTFLSVLLLIYYLVFKAKRDMPVSLKKSKKKFKFKDIGKLFKSTSFLLIFFGQLLFSATVSTFTIFGADLMQHHFDVSVINSGTYVSIFLLSIAILAPLLAFYLDKRKSVGKFLIHGSLVIFFSFIILFFKLVHPIFSLFLIALGCALLSSSMLPIVPKTVDSEYQGSAFGALNTGRNIGVWSITLFIGFLLKYFNPMSESSAEGDKVSLDYSMPILGWIVLTFILFVISFLLHRVVKKRKLS
ncbi:MAG: nitrate/nitrite transporter [Hyphomicrobiales bacterium]